jgi:hypothetical protein
MRRVRVSRYLAKVLNNDGMLLRLEIELQMMKKYMTAYFCM